MRVGRFLVSPELLHDALLLPADCDVRQLTWNHAKQMYEISVSGTDQRLQEVAAGCEVALVSPWYREVDGAPEFAGWDWPNKGTTAACSEAKDAVN